MNSLINFIMSLIGAIVLIGCGAVIGFWLDIIMTPPLPNGFKECTDCGVSFAQNLRWWMGK